MKMTKKQIMTLLLALDLALVSCAAVAGLFCLHWYRQLDTVPDSGYSADVVEELTREEADIRQDIADMHEYIAQREAESQRSYAEAQKNWSEKYNALCDAEAQLEDLTGENGS